MKCRLSGTLAWFIPLFMLAAKSAAWGPPTPTPLPDFDQRTKGFQVGDVVSGDQRSAMEQLRAQLPSVRMDFDPVTGAPKIISADGTFLSGTNGQGKAISASSYAGLAPDDRYRVTRAFLKEHRQLFGFGPEALDQARVARDFITPHNGLRTVVWEQQLDGIRVFEAVLISHTTRKGELVNIGSQFVADAGKAAERGTPNRAALETAPTITAQQAVALAALNVGDDLRPEQVTPCAPSEAGAERKQKFTAPALRGETEAKLTWLPMEKQTLRLCWDVILMSRARNEMYRILVDTRTGEVLLRHCLTEYLSDASYRVFTSDSPSPFSPGYATPVTNQPPLISRTLVTLSALDTNASPAGWINDGDNETLGNNVDAHTDWNRDDLPDLPRPQGSPFRVFDFPMDLTTQDPTNYAAAAVVQLFYWNNFMHDRLYELGFTEAAGNFQSTNFGRGGLGNDAVQADAQDGSDNNNANFSTPPDGSAPRMQMFIFTGPSPRRDGDLDAEVVLHEYTHGLSNRRVGGGVGISLSQSRGMGEGWSDFYAESLLSEAGDDVNGNYAAGAYVSYQYGGAANLPNYYFGIRRYPYTTDMTKNPLTFKDIDPAQADYCSSGAPYNTGVAGNCTGADADEVHNQGEVWCVTLWEARANRINQYGWAVGNQLMLQLVTDGMNLSPPNPNFLEARDAILQADLVDTGGANRHELWAAFAKRGMGFSATSPSSSTTAGVHESFDLPDDLQITPGDGLVGRGPVGGPFTPSSAAFVLTNAGSNSFAWTLANTASWLDVSPTNGTLDPGGPAVSVYANLNATAVSLPTGVYSTTVWFTNLDSLAGQSRLFSLLVGQPDYYTELFERNITNLSFQTFTFTPDGSASFYEACRQAAAAFPTDPTGGTTLSPMDDNYVQATISGGNTVAIYNTRTNVFFIGSNGYLTMGSGDDFYMESYTNHFTRPRVSALYHDLISGTGNSISWKQLANRVAVTYQGVPVYGTSTLTNSFQIELFFDGRIRITYLNVNAPGALVGLSAGTGLPANFEASDFNYYGACSPLALALPPSAAENAGVLTNGGTVLLGSVLPTNLVVSLVSSVPGRMTVPPTTTVPAGQPSGSFNLTMIDNSIQDGDQLVTITASAPGFTNVSSSTLVVDDDTPPPILIQPASQSVFVGGNVIFRVTATGKGPVSYFWRRNGTPIAGANTASYAINNAQLADSGSQFSCLVSNFYGTTLSSNAVLTVAINQGPLFHVDFESGLQGFTIDNTAGGGNGLWHLSTGRALDPGHSPSNSLYYGQDEGPNGGGNYDIGTNSGGVVISPPIILPLGAAQFILSFNYLTDIDPFETYDLAYVEVSTNEGASYVSVAEKNVFGGLSNDTGGLWVSNSVDLSAFGGWSVRLYFVFDTVVTPFDFLEGWYLDDITISAITPPVVAVQPANQTVGVGDAASFSVTVSGTAPLGYFWRRNGAAITGANSSSCTANNVQLADSGSQFSCLVSNTYGVALSSNAVLTVVPPPGPTIQLALSGNVLLFFWPASSQGFVLETSPSLSPATWVPVPNPPIQIGDQYVVPVNLSGPMGFYRLRHP